MAAGFFSCLEEIEIYAKKIELFLVNGTADSIITAELSNWNGMAVKFREPKYKITTEKI